MATIGPLEFKIEKEESGRRIDHHLTQLKLATRAEIKRWIERGFCLLNHQHTRPATKLTDGDLIQIYLPKAIERAEAEDIALDILYEDEDLIVVDKAANMVVHPAPSYHCRTLVGALLFHCKSLSSIGWPLRPGIVHRLDRLTSGIVVAAKTDDAHRDLVRQFAEHSIERFYQAIVLGEIKSVGVFDTLHSRHPRHPKRFTTKVSEGRRAITHYRPLEIFRSASLVAAKLETGRTHQVRVHFHEHGYPLIGDPLYGRIRDPELRKLGHQLGRQALHASQLSFDHPRDKKRLCFKSELPQDMRWLLNALRICESNV